MKIHEDYHEDSMKLYKNYTNNKLSDNPLRSKKNLL